VLLRQAIEVAQQYAKDVERAVYTGHSDSVEAYTSDHYKQVTVKKTCGGDTIEPANKDHPYTYMRPQWRYDKSDLKMIGMMLVDDERGVEVKLIVKKSVGVNTRTCGTSGLLGRAQSKLQCGCLWTTAMNPTTRTENCTGAEISDECVF
jgi:hypothetical protein